MIERLVAIQMKHNPQTKVGSAIVVVELLTAMREPTEKMLDAGINIGPDKDPFEYWLAMLGSIVDE